MILASVRQSAVGRNAELTYRFNRKSGRHGWLRLTPAYSVKLVESLLQRSDPNRRILDPFSGTGTTLLCAAYHNNMATGIEINPFLVWLANAKVAAYSLDLITELRQAVGQLAKSACDSSTFAPPIHNIRRWWGEDELAFLRTLKAGLDRVATEGSQAKDLLLVGFCRTLIELSNAAFNHQSMSFKPTNTSQRLLFTGKPDFMRVFREDMDRVLTSAQENPAGHAEIVEGDSRDLSSLGAGQYDLLITSPPYPNRMSYIRELRPYMYWLGHLTEARDAGELDWAAIGGTWGIATSRLADWTRSPESFYPKYFVEILANISRAGSKNGVLLSNYVAKYFEDIWVHIREVWRVMGSGARLHYIVGNSTFYKVLLPVEKLYAEMLAEVGFRDVNVTPIRKRNSKKELFEFDVSAGK